MEQPWPDPARARRLEHPATGPVIKPHGKPEHAVTRPVFTDPSGRRRRLMLMVGAGASVLCVAALTMVGVGLVGGPNTPFTLWGTPHSPTSHGRHASREAHTDKSGHPSGPGLTSQQGGQRTTSPGTPPSPKTSPTPSPKTDPTPSASPTPSKSPQGQGRSNRPSHTPNPHSPSPKHSIRFAHAG